MRRRRVDRLLLWYPPAWRARYGDELKSLMEDMEPLSLRSRLGVIVGGGRERVRQARRPRPPAERARTGLLLVLAAWALVMVAGPSFANLADGFTRALPPHAGSVPVGAYVAVVAFAIVGALAMLSGAAIAVPSLLRLLRTGGWGPIGRVVRRALVATPVGAVAFAVLVVVTHASGPVQDSTWSLLVFCVVAALWVVVVGFWTTVAGSVLRRMDLPPHVLRAESVLALAAAGSLVLLAVAAAVWWGTVAQEAPWFLQVSPVHPGGSVLNPQALATEIVLVLGAAVGTAGAARAWQQARL
jgi:hypothetical protein